MIDLFLKRGILALFFLIVAYVKVQAFVPAAFVKDTFLRFAAQELFFSNDLIVRAVAVEQRHLIEKLYQLKILLKRNRQIVCSPRIVDRLAFTAACRSTGLLLKFKKNKVMEVFFS